MLWDLSSSGKKKQYNLTTESDHGEAEIKVLVELFHRAVRGSVLLKHSGFALRRRSVKIKVLVELF